MILGSSGLSMLIVGTVLACRAERYAGYTNHMELVAGWLIVGGLSLIGVGVAWALNPGVLMSP
jgi:hypothetical protein